MMKIKYVGEGQVEVDGVGIFIPNQPIEIPDEKAEDLLKNPLFIKVTEERSFETNIHKKKVKNWEQDI